MAWMRRSQSPPRHSTVRAQEGNAEGVLGAPPVPRLQREGMLAEAADRAGADTVATMARVAASAPPEQALNALLRAYLSKAHVVGVETGCAVAALGSEMPRQASRVLRAATRRIKEMVDLVARHSPEWGQPGAHERALVTIATAVGALVLARAVDDPKLSDALRHSALKHLTPTG